MVHHPFQRVLKLIPLTTLTLFVCGTMGAVVLLQFWHGAHKTVVPAQNTKVFRMNISTEPPNLDPIKITDLVSYNVVLNLMRGLTQFGGDGKGVQPAVASHWDISSDGMQYTFYLRPNAVWNDGQPVTANDFIYNWKRALDPDNASEYAFFLFYIKNAQAYYRHEVPFSQVGIKAVNPHTLVVQLGQPVAFFLDLLASPVALPLRQDMFEQYGERFTEAGHFLSNGPYVLSSWQHESRITLKPNPSYWGSKPQVDTVEMLMVNDANTSVVMYENHELDYIETPSSIPSADVRRLKKRPDCHTQLIHALYYFGFNTRKPPFNNPKVRQAFAYALDRSYYPHLLQSGQKAFSSWITPGLAGYNPKVGIQYNPQKAKQLLAEAGYPDGKSFPEVSLAYRSLYDIQKEAEIAQFLWKKNLNVSVHLQNLDWKVFLEKLNNETPDIYRQNWYVDYPDADSFMNLFLSTNGNNSTGWKNAQYDAWVQQAALIREPNRRQQLYDRAQHLLLEQETPMVPIYLGEKNYLLNPKVHGLKLNALNLINLDNLSLSP